MNRGSRAGTRQLPVAIDKTDAAARRAAEARLGEMLAEMPLSDKRASSSKGTCSLPPIINTKQSHYAQTFIVPAEEP